MAFWGKSMATAAGNLRSNRVVGGFDATNCTDRGVSHRRLRRTDPLYMASICTEMASSADAQTAPAKTQHDHGDCCVFCAAGHGGAIAIEPPPPVFVSLQRQYQHVAWLEAADPMSAGRVGSNAQARAPPQLM